MGVGRGISEKKRREEKRRESFGALRYVLKNQKGFSTVSCDRRLHCSQEIGSANSPGEQASRSMSDEPNEHEQHVAVGSGSFSSTENSPKRRHNA